MATLFNTKISNTYQGLLKTVDNAAISATLRELSDGSGNQTGLYLNTAGDFKVTSVLEWGSLKDTGTGVTITRYVTSTDGLENFDNNTSLPTSAAVKLYVDTKFATSDTLQEVLSFGNTTSGNDIVVSANDDITFTDSSKALFGNSQDLEINHNGTDSFVTDLGTGDLRLRSDNSIKIQASTGGNNLATFTKGAGVDLYFNNAKKLETTNTGISVTGIISNLTNPIAAQDAATKSYVDALDAGSDLDITDGTNTGAVNLNTQTLSILGTTNEIEAVVSGQGVTIGLPSSISTDLVGNVTGNLTGNVAGDLTGNVTSTSVLANGVTATTQASTDSSTKVATTAYVKGLDNASDLDFSGDSGTGDVNLNAQTFAITGTANQIESSASNQGLSLQFPTAGVTLPNGSVATTQSADDNSTKVATTSYVDTSAALYLPLVGGIMSGNTIHNDSVKSIYGTGSDAQVYHDGSNFYANNSTGQLNIDQSAVTESIVFKTSDANALDTTALIINRGGDLITGRDVTIAGDLTVNGTTTTVNSQTLSVDDPLISLAINNAANSLDIGYYGKYNDGTTRYLGLFNDSSDSNKFKLFKGTTVEPTTTVNIGAAGYVAADLELANLVATGNINLADNGKAIFGTGNDLQIYHDGSNSYISNEKNSLIIQNNSDDKQVIIKSDNGSGGIADYFRANGITGEAILYHYGSQKLSTTSTGVSVTGGGTFAGDVIINKSSGKIDFRDGGGSSKYFLELANSNADLQINDRTGAGSVSMTIQSGGNVGIGTVSPSAKLDIQGDDYFTDIGFNLGVNTNREYKFTAKAFAGNKYNLEIGNDNSGNHYDVSFINDGNVGIGTDSPDVKLHLKGTDIRLRLQENTSNVTAVTNDMEGLELSMLGVSGIGRYTPMLKFMSADTSFTTKNPKLLAYVTGISEASYISDAGGKMGLSFGTSPIVATGVPVERMRIDGDGNVGIGTDNPDTTLHIDGGNANNVATFESTDDTARIILKDDDTTGYFIAKDNVISIGGSTTIANNLNVDVTSNNVGIGTDSPTNGKLVIDSDTAPQILVKNSSGANSQILFEDNDGLTQSADITFDQSGNNSLTIKTNYAGSNLLLQPTSGNVGIGTDSPDHKLRVDGDARLGNLHIKTSDFGVGGTGKTIYADGAGGGLLGFISTTAFDFSNGATSRMRIDASGNVGIGTTSPSAKLQVKGAGTSAIDEVILLEAGNSVVGSGSGLSFASSAFLPTYPNWRLAQISAIYETSNTFNGALVFKTSTAQDGGTERMRITSGGNVLIGTTGVPNGTTSYGSAFIVSGSGLKQLFQASSTTTAVSLQRFYNPNGNVGSIATSGSATAYNTSSDYRLKEDLQDFAGLDMVSKIPVYDFKWKTDESRSYGVMAHELQEVLPDAVTGEKDAEEMQGVDYSKIVPLLIKSIQELKAEIDILKAK